MRTSTIERKTAETDISMQLVLDGSGKSDINTGVGFFNHMLILTTMHGGIDLQVTCNGDLETDQHHSVEDVGIALGTAFKEAIGTKESIERYASVTVPMDEALAEVSMDISGRSFLVYNVSGLKDKIGAFDTELAEEFFLAFTRHAEVTLHINLQYGKNSHHILESIFKGFGRAIRVAAAKNGRQGIPSTKGML
ncbi:imidazoleglycerol-phosphate dehydratase HisB [Sporosarcina gallistercoris]|uniref:Imidazoleglycerol-phosphate dehydratase n=1 Tax=Sporosarcina gallistercoris TaxID=2762245 RepID=A0ABR8PI50_9BACL|nr:imidazoleglycerol-phosphate dehydratase HisB [Sporosarcina gallistercoris]MBD7907840.1 imidazoleglycerol-phosphate dehydratase HisB [Sporosarcina gallistercoris]